MLVSFIIPAYNAADTIVRCLESIYGLSLKREEFEVIVIDDCSADETVSIIEDWRLKIENLILLKQPENHRQGAARNRGVKVAKGEYICFVDADDAVTEGIVKAIRLAKEKLADMVALHSENVNESGETTSEIQKMKDMEGKEFSGIELQNRHPYWCSAPWGYIYSKSFMDKTSYPFREGVLYEDADFVTAHLYYAKRMTYSSLLGYLAYYREGSTTHTITHKNIADFILLGVRMLRLYERVMSDVSCKLYDVSEAEINKFAEDVLEGACWNMRVSTKRMIKLSRIEEVRLCYDRLDTCLNRQELCADNRLHKYYWNLWTTICLAHKRLAIMLLSVLIPMYKYMKLLRK